MPCITEVTASLFCPLISLRSAVCPVTSIHRKIPKLQITPKAAQLFSHCLLLEATTEVENLLAKVKQVTFNEREESDEPLERRQRPLTSATSIYRDSAGEMSQRANM